MEQRAAEDGLMVRPTPVTLHAHAVLTPSRRLSPGWVTVRGSVVTALGSGRPPTEGHVVRLGGHLIVPGYVDLHVHGGGGAQVNGDSANDVRGSVRRFADHHVRHGTTALLATAVSCPPDELLEVVRGIAACMEDPQAGARILGAHLEGPWLSPARAGAQDIHFLRPPDAGELGRLQRAAPDTIRRVTLAPELPGALALIGELTRHRIVASIGHTDADFATAQEAIEAGATSVTHLFNAMPGLHHRDPGPAAAALRDARVTVELIADGVHIHPAVLALVVRAAPGRVVAVTDAVAATGLAAGRHEIGHGAVDVAAGRVSMVDAPQTLAGSVLTMDEAVANLVRAGVSVQEAVTAATATPARTIEDSSIGVIRVGSGADLAILDPELRCSATVVGGRAVHDPEDLLQGALPAPAG